MTETKSWRDHLAEFQIKVHPAAEKFEMLPDDELDELAADIAANGLNDGVVLWTPDRKSYGDQPPEENFLLDGRNRLAAIVRAFADPGERNSAFKVALTDGIKVFGVAIAPPRQLYGGVDPVTYVIAANIRRRHQTPDRRADVIRDLKAQRPDLSIRTLAEMTNTPKSTVARMLDKPKSPPTASPVPGRDTLSPPARVTGRDGKSYPVAKLPKTASVGPSPARIRAMVEARERSARVMSGSTRSDAPKPLEVAEVAKLNPPAPDPDLCRQTVRQIIEATVSQLDLDQQDNLLVALRDDLADVARKIRQQRRAEGVEPSLAEKRIAGAERVRHHRERKRAASLSGKELHA